MSKLIIITGAQGSGKTTKDLLKELHGKEFLIIDMDYDNRKI